jgi:hypothetical protein
MTVKRRRTPEEIREMKRRLAAEVEAIKQEVKEEVEVLLRIFGPRELAERCQRKLQEVEARLDAKAVRRKQLTDLNKPTKH